MPTRFTSLASLFALTACIQPAGDVASIEEALTDPVPLSTGLHEVAIESDGRQRVYLVYLPMGFDPMDRYPLVVMYHGFSGSAQALANKMLAAGMPALLTAEPKIVVFMQGTVGTSVTAPGWWDAGVARDDIVYTDDVIEHLSDAMIVDDDHVYAAGHSLGAHFTHWLASDDRDRFDAIADVSGFYGTVAVQPPASAGSIVPVFIVHGDDDIIVPLTGGAGGLGLDYLPTQDTYDTWYSENGCTEPTQSLSTCGFLPGGNLVCWDIQQTDCTPGADTTIQMIVLDPHGHSWPLTTDGLDTVGSMLGFFDLH
jgi:polyhydroxybutyrate depolymerase